MTQASKTRVLLVDDDASIRETVPAAIEALDPSLEVHAVAGVASCLATIRNAFKPRVVVLDLRLDSASERLGGLALLPVLRAPVVIYSASDVPRSVRERVHAVVSKGAPPEQLLQAIRGAIAGHGATDTP